MSVFDYESSYKQYRDHFSGYEDIPTIDWFIYEAKNNEKFANKWLTPKIKKLVRFAEDDTYTEIFINMNEFKPSKEFSDEIFGWYGNSYICIKK
jgi:hypothetical protein